MKFLNFKSKISNSQKGFTLIEAVVSTSVFAFVVSSVLGVYLATIRIDSKTRAERTVQQNARFIMDYLGKEIRNGRIDYSSYQSGTITYTSGYTTDLYLTNQLSEAERIYCNGTDLTLAKTIGVTNLNSDGVTVSRCAFYIDPSTNPFQPLGGSPPNQQPFVTVVLQLQYAYGTRSFDTSTINLQSSFSVRDYPTRE